MKKEVLITVKGSQRHEWGDEDTIELTTLGYLYKKTDCYYLVYQESEISGMEGTTTTIKVEPSRVTLNRMGKNEQKSVFETGVFHECMYITPFGMMSLAVHPSEVFVDLTEVGGTIKLLYELNLERQKVSDNFLSIEVREA